jgi:hypothetical protein
MPRLGIRLPYFGRCFSHGQHHHHHHHHKKQNKDTQHYGASASIEDDKSNDKFRSRGQELLKALLEDDSETSDDVPSTGDDIIDKNNSCNSSNNNTNKKSGHKKQNTKLNWNSVIQNTKELQRGEKEAFNRHQRINRLKMLKRAMERRRLDSTGSWNANIVTYNESSSPRSTSSKGYVCSCCCCSTTTSSSDGDDVRDEKKTGYIKLPAGSDEGSRSSTSTRSIRTMQVIEEELEYI